MNERLYCAECFRLETDPIFLDVERCSVCGELLDLADDRDDFQPDEAAEWHDYDPDC